LLQYYKEPVLAFCYYGLTMYCDLQMLTIYLSNYFEVFLLKKYNNI